MMMLDMLGFFPTLFLLCFISINSLLPGFFSSSIDTSYLTTTAETGRDPSGFWLALMLTLAASDSVKSTEMERLDICACSLFLSLATTTTASTTGLLFLAERSGASETEAWS